MVQVSMGGLDGRRYQYPMKHREVVAWALAAFLFLLLVASRMGNQLELEALRGSGLLKVWHGGSPENPHIRGTCWCSAQDGYCMCNPSLAIDVILLSGDEHMWLVKRKDTNQYATMGGFVNVGESAEDAVMRELQEETSFEIEPKHLSLLGFYSDPKRDKRRHTASAVFVARIPQDKQHTPHAADDVKEVVRFPISEVLDLDLFADHHTIILDYLRLHAQQALAGQGPQQHLTSSLADPISRTVCKAI